MAMLSLADEIEVVGEASNGHEAIALSARTNPHVILMDIRMPGMDGIEATREITQRQADIHILMLTTFDEDEYVMGALKAGASGYLLKDTSPRDLIAAIGLVHHGHVQLGPAIAAKVLSRLQPYVPKERSEILQFMSTREQEVLRLIARGFSNQELANRLSLTEGTVRNYVSNILTQLGVRDRTQAALWAHNNLRLE
jgi:DNA-binding NarL/FixJ family response regulator